MDYICRLECQHGCVAVGYPVFAALYRCNTHDLGMVVTRVTKDRPAWKLLAATREPTEDEKAIHRAIKHHRV